MHKFLSLNEGYSPSRFFYCSCGKWVTEMGTDRLKASRWFHEHLKRVMDRGTV